MSGRAAVRLAGLALVFSGLTAARAEDAGGRPVVPDRTPTETVSPSAAAGGQRPNVSSDNLGAAEESPTYPKLSLGIVGGIYGTASVFTYLAWYRRADNSPTLQFRQEGWFGTDTYAGGADKIGHMWANYALTRGVSGIMEWGGYSKRAALITSTSLTLGFFALIEVKDGYQPEYGFSWGDVLFNVSGVALGLAMDCSPKLDEMFDFHIEYWPSRYFIDESKSKGPFNVAEDYTGQRFLVSYHLASIDWVRESRYVGWTEWLDLTLGYRALHFKPAAGDPNERTQNLFAGVALNLQHVLDRTVLPRPDAGKHPSTGLRALRYGTEIVALPFTSLTIGGVSRAGPQP